MNFGNCVKCGKAISYENVRICADCKEKEFERVKEYIEENGKTNLGKISIDLKISRKLLIDFVVEGRLDASSVDPADVKEALEEERRKKLLSEINLLNSTAKKPDNKVIVSDDNKRNKMRFLNKR